ncbi:MAG: VWA domain-containing protein [Desulfobacter sp.]|nr:MAG: VWA domain-containing protein [Desulfobacter sp.]
MTKHMSRFFSIYLFCILFSALAFPWGTAMALCPIIPDGTYIEAENFVSRHDTYAGANNHDRFTIISVTGTNGGKVIAAGKSGGGGVTPYNEILEYPVYFSQAGTYYMWVRGKGNNSNSDSVFFTVDSEPWSAWNLGPTYTSYVWKNTIQVGSDNTIHIDAAGEHTLKLAMRESYTRIDGIYITSDSGDVPTDDDVPGKVTTINPKADCSGAFWAVAPTNLGPTTFEGYNADPVNITLTNAAAGITSTGAKISSNQSWVSVDHTDIPDLAPGDTHTLTVNFNTTGLSDGIHNAELTITGSASNAPVKIPVTLLVKEAPSTASCGEIPLYAESLVNPGVMVMLDTSGSMKTSVQIAWGQYQRRIDIAEDVIEEVFEDRSIAWGFATWTGSSLDGHTYKKDYTNFRVGVHEHDQAHQDALQDKADDGYPKGNTPLVPALRAGLKYFKSLRQDGHYKELYSKLSCQPRIIVLITDGYGNVDTSNTTIDKVMDDLIKEEISVVTVGFGLSDATQLQRIVNKMTTAGNASDSDYLYSLHKKNSSGKTVPFMATTRTDFIKAMNDIVSNVKSQIFHGASPAATTATDNGAVLLTSSFDASDWTGNITATKFNKFTGALETSALWNAETVMPANTNHWFIYDDASSSGVAGFHPTLSPDAKKSACQLAMGDIINSSPAIVGLPPYQYRFDDYFDTFKYSSAIMNRDETAYVAANDGALHAFSLSDGVEKWRFYPRAVRVKLAEAVTNPKADRCSSTYCHRFLLDGSPRPADIYTGSKGWRTILTTGLGRGGSAFFAIDITFGESFNAPNKIIDSTSVPVRSEYLWEFTDPELGKATSLPETTRLHTSSGGSGWATLFGSGNALTDPAQADKEAYLFAVDAWNMNKVWLDAGGNKTSRLKLSAATLKNDSAGIPLAMDTHNNDYISDRVYVGNQYGNLYRIKDIGYDQMPVSQLFFDAKKTDRSTPALSKPAAAYAGGSDYWIYFGTGQYETQLDKSTGFQQYFFGLFDPGASKASPYTRPELVSYTANIVEGYALNQEGDKIDINKDGVIDTKDQRRYRTLTCDNPGINSVCNPDKKSWVIKLASGVTASERVLSQPSVSSGTVKFTTFIPDDDVCEGSGDTWIMAVDWETGAPKEEEVFKGKGHQVVDKDGNIHETVGYFVAAGKPSGQIVRYNTVGFVGTTNGSPDGQPVTAIPFNEKGMGARLKAWQQQFK